MILIELLQEEGCWVVRTAGGHLAAQGDTIQQAFASFGEVYQGQMLLDAELPPLGSAERPHFVTGLLTVDFKPYPSAACPVPGCVDGWLISDGLGGAEAQQYRCTWPGHGKDAK